MGRALFLFAGGLAAGAGSAFRFPCAFTEGFVPGLVLENGGAALGTRPVDIPGDMVVGVFFRELLEHLRSGPREAAAPFFFILKTDGSFVAGATQSGLAFRVSRERPGLCVEVDWLPWLRLDTT